MKGGRCGTVRAQAVQAPARVGAVRRGAGVWDHAQWVSPAFRTSPGPVTHKINDRGPCHAPCLLVHRRSSRKRGLAGACSRMWAWACCCCRPAQRTSLHGSPRGGQAPPRGCCAHWLCTIWRYVQVRTRARPGTVPPPGVATYVAPEVTAMYDKSLAVGGCWLR